MTAIKSRTDLKIVKGSYREDRHGGKVEVEAEAPKCPTWLPKSSKKYWNQLAPKLVESGLISSVDTAMFSLHCDSVGRFQEITKILSAINDLVDETPQGYQVQSALFTIRNKLWDQVCKSSTEFGLSPASRSKVKAPSKDKLDDDKWGDL